MNRKQRREFITMARKNGFSWIEIDRWLNIADCPIIPEGAKVRLNYEKITGYQDHKKKSQFYRQFVEENRGKVFTVEYDPGFLKEPKLVCFKEDSTPLKWLWFTGDLEVVNADCPVE